jgi:hypothetical protein
MDASLPTRIKQCFNAMESIMPQRCVRSGGIVLIILKSALGGGESSASRHCRFTPRDRVPGINCIGSWVAPREGVDAVECGKNLSPTGNQTPVVQPVARSYTV